MAMLNSLVLLTALNLAPTGGELREVPKSGVAMQVSGALMIPAGALGLLSGATLHTWHSTAETASYLTLGVGGLVGGSFLVHYGRRRWSTYSRWRAGASSGRDPVQRRGSVMLAFGYGLLAPAITLGAFGVGALASPLPTGEGLYGRSTADVRRSRNIGGGVLLGTGAAVAALAIPLIVYGHRRRGAFKEWKTRHNYAIAPAFGSTARRTSTYGVVMSF